MTPEDRQRFLMETEDSVRQFAALVEARNAGSTGIPKPPEIIVTETETETERFGLKLDPKDESSSASPGAPSSTTPPFVCPDGLSITFSGIVLDCECSQTDHSGHHAVLTDTSLNGTDSLVNESDSVCPPKCFWESETYASLLVHVKRHLVDTDCSDPPDAEFDDQLGGLFAVRDVDGTWHVWVEIYNNLLFYGTTTDPLSPISNTLLSCTGDTFVTFDNSVTDCVFAGPVDRVVAGHGGTATINFP